MGVVLGRKCVLMYCLLVMTYSVLVPECVSAGKVLLGGAAGYVLIACEQAAVTDT